MGAAYFIAINSDEPGFDSFVNGKAIALDSEGLERVTQSLGLKEINEFVSAAPEELAAMAEEFGVDEPFDVPDEEWFEADEGLGWIAAIREFIESHPDSVSDSQAVLSELAEYQAVLEQVKAAGLRWHFSVDF